MPLLQCPKCKRFTVDFDPYFQKYKCLIIDCDFMEKELPVVKDIELIKELILCNLEEYLELDHAECDHNISGCVDWIYSIMSEDVKHIMTNQYEKAIVYFSKEQNNEPTKNLR